MIIIAIVCTSVVFVFVSVIFFDKVMRSIVFDLDNLYEEEKLLLLKVINKLIDKYQEEENTREMCKWYKHRNNLRSSVKVGDK